MKVKTVNYEGIASEIEVSLDVYEFDKEDFWKIDWQERRFDQENSIEEMYEHNQKVSNHQSLPDAVISKSPEAKYIQKLRIEELYGALKQLPEKQKRRLVLYYFCDLTFKEIGVIENVSVRAVAYSASAAIKNLKKILEKINL